MSNTRSYHSAIREQKKEQTRAQILEAVVQTLQGGVAEVTIPAVARAAGLSVPTVYRHFASKQALLDALPAYLAQQLGLAGKPLPRTPDELAAMVYDLYATMESKESLLRGALLSELASEIRQANISRRVQMIEALMEGLPFTLTEPDRVRLRNTLLVLSSSAVVRAYKDYLGLTWEEAADNAAWAIRTLTSIHPYQKGEDPHDPSSDPA